MTEVSLLQTRKILMIVCDLGLIAKCDELMSGEGDGGLDGVGAGIRHGGGH